MNSRTLSRACGKISLAVLAALIFVTAVLAGRGLDFAYERLVRDALGFPFLVISAVFAVLGLVLKPRE
ncbi:hypothetical protein [Streptomyces sp. NPDC004291]